MSIFDDLADPLGPPAGDALGRVLSRARRRRVARRSATALIAVTAVAAIAVSANALTSGSGAGRSLSTVAPSTAVRPTTAETFATSTTTAPTPTSPATTSSTRPVAGNGSWADRRLTITPRSLGRVELGMTLAEAQTAAGIAFDGAADGAFYPTRLPAGYPHLFVNENSDNTVSCFGAEIGSHLSSPQTVSTPEGFRLGDSAVTLKLLYGNRAVYSPAPASGIAPRAGYVVEEPDGALAFDVDTATNRIFGIKSGAAGLTPSSCNG